MSLENEILLGSRFKIEIDQNNQKALKPFENTKENQKNFIVSRVDNHVFIRIQKEKQPFWSPQLHIEIYEINANKSKVRGFL